MYKVFFNDRTVFIGDDFSRAFSRNRGLFYKYNSFQELEELVEMFSALQKINNLYIFHPDMLMLSDQFKACFKMIEAGGGLVFNELGEFLAIKRNGSWDLPKGKLEKGEDFPTAALREVEEETGTTSKERVWAGGDIVTGAATVMLAMGAGRLAARSMQEYLSK